MNLFFENMKWLRGSSSSGRGVDEKVVVEVMTILMIVMMILIMMVILMIILMMVMMILSLPCHASKVMWNPLPDKVADLVESSISIIHMMMMMMIHYIISCHYGHELGGIKHKQPNLIFC